MRVIWRRGQATAATVIADLKREEPGRHPKTVRTMLARLVEKGSIGYVQKGNQYQYSALVTEPECIAAAIRSFVGSVLGGSVAPILAYLMTQNEFTQQQLDQLRSVVEMLGGGLG